MGCASKLQIDLKKDCQYKIYQLKGPNRLVVDIFRINIIKQTSPVAQGVTYTYMQDEMNGKQIKAYLVSVALMHHTPSSAVFSLPVPIMDVEV